MKYSVPFKIFSVAIFFLLFSISIAQDNPRTLYSINASAETLSKMNMNTSEINSNLITTGQAPNQLVAHNDMLYLVNSATDNIFVIDPKNDSAVKKIIPLDEGSNPWFMAFVSETKAYVTNYNLNSVSVIDVENGSIINSIPVRQTPEGIIVVGERAFITNAGYMGWNEPYASGTVSVIDTQTETVIYTLNVPTNPQDLALAPDEKIHVICTGNYIDSFGAVAVINNIAASPTVVDTIEIGGTPGDIEITKSGKGYCIAWGDMTNGYLYKYDALTGIISNNVDNPILVGPNVSRLMYDSKEDVLWIPYMTEWGGDGFAQKYNVNADSVIWTSGVLGNGVYDLTILEPIVSSIDENLTGQPAQFELHQNYPNPFNPTTTIKYSLPAGRQEFPLSTVIASSNDLGRSNLPLNKITSSYRQVVISRNDNVPVTLKIYDILGREVTTLVSEEKRPGNYNVEFNASLLPSGVYYYRLSAGEFMQTRKMLYLK